MCLLNRLALASRAEDNGCVSSLVTKNFIREIIRKYVYWAKPGLGEYEGGSLLLYLVVTYFQSTGKEVVAPVGFSMAKQRIEMLL